MLVGRVIFLGKFVTLFSVNAINYVFRLLAESVKSFLILCVYLIDFAKVGRFFGRKANAPVQDLSREKSLTYYWKEWEWGREIKMKELTRQMRFACNVDDSNWVWRQFIHHCFSTLKFLKNNFHIDNILL